MLFSTTSKDYPQDNWTVPAGDGCGEPLHMEECNKSLAHCKLGFLKQQLDWFEDELLKSEKKNEAVLILNHFSTNTYFMNKRKDGG